MSNQAHSALNSGRPKHAPRATAAARLLGGGVDDYSVMAYCTVYGIPKEKVTWGIKTTQKKKSNKEDDGQST